MHNEEHLPWEKIASHFQPAFVHLTPAKISVKTSNFTTEFEHRWKLKADKNIREFLEVLKTTLKADAEKLRLSLPEDVPPVQINEPAIDDEAAHAISVDMQRYLRPIVSRRSCFRDKPDVKKIYFDLKELSSTICHHDIATQCDCLLPSKARTPSIYKPVARRTYDNEWRDRTPGSRAFAINALGALLKNQQPLPVMRLFHHFDLGHVRWYNEFSQCFDRLFEACLAPYLTLNILLARPETWHPKFKKKPWHDYRDTALYQTMVNRCTHPTKVWETRLCCTVYHLHRDFFDVPDINWVLMPWGRKSKSRLPERWWSAARCDEPRVEFGTLPFSSFISSSSRKSRRQVGIDDIAVDVNTVRCFMAYKGLPPEITDIILSMANAVDLTYHLRVPDDPLHPHNLCFLEGYLDRCWKTMVACYVAMGMQNIADQTWNRALDSTLDLFILETYRSVEEKKKNMRYY